jgi:SNF2 family DNA or RNA helicase
MSHDNDNNSKSSDGNEADARLDAALRASGVVLVPHPHQRDGVRWWLAREGTSAKARAAQSGGIVADEMGLGKSMSAVMSVLLCRSALAGPLVRSRPITPRSSAWAATSAPVPAVGRASAGGSVTLAPTLIVCPKSLLLQWQREIVRHTSLSPDDIHLFYGRSGRRATRRQVADKVFVLTTYEIVLASFEHLTDPPARRGAPLAGMHPPPSAEMLPFARATVVAPPPPPDSKRLGTSLLHDIVWDRIILDEAHVIRNWQTSKTHRATCALQSARRWCLTGTAFNNSASDVVALCRFIGVAPYSEPRWWTDADEDQARAWRDAFLLRRTKAMIASRRSTDTGLPNEVALSASAASLSDPASMPPKIEKVRRVPLSEREAAFYDGLAVGAVADFGSFLLSKGADRSRMFGQMLEWLTRLRQACCDPLVLKGRAATVVYSLASSPDRNRYQSYCARCSSTAANEPASALIRLTCGHAVCADCTRDDHCDLCHSKPSPPRDDHVAIAQRSGGGGSNAPRATPLTPCGRESTDPSVRRVTEPACGPSSRTQSMIRFMNKIFAKDSRAKMVVFSQWSTYLDLIESAIVTHVGVDYVRIDGGIRQIERRNALVDRFVNDRDARCLLMTIGVGSVGLNLVCANYVLLMDAHYNPFAEDQAVDRVHRIGQTRPVRVVRFLSDASVDAAIAQIQAAKRVGAAAFLQGDDAHRRSTDFTQTHPPARTPQRYGALTVDRSDPKPRAIGSGATTATTPPPNPTASSKAILGASGLGRDQLRSILKEMIAARRDTGNQTVDSFVIARPSGGMQCNVGNDDDSNDDDDDDEYCRHTDNDSIDDDDDDSTEDDFDERNRIDRDDEDSKEKDDDNRDNGKGLRRRPFRAPLEKAPDRLVRSRHRGGSNSSSDDNTSGTGRRLHDRNRNAKGSGRRGRLVARCNRDDGDGGAVENDDEYDIAIVDSDARAPLRRLKRTRDVIQSGKRAPCPTKRLCRRSPRV